MRETGLETVSRNEIFNGKAQSIPPVLVYYTETEYAIFSTKRLFAGIRIYTLMSWILYRIRYGAVSLLAGEASDYFGLP
jgi:hypothetical protein